MPFKLTLKGRTGGKVTPAMLKRSFYLTVKGEKLATEIVNTLIDKSQWFEFLPLPDGEYEITVKQENQELLETLAGVN